MQVPSDYGQLAELYGEDIRRVVSRQLGPGFQQHVDDEVQYCLAQLHPGGNRSGLGVIEQYSPDVRSQYDGHLISFRSFLLRKVVLYCKGRRQSLGTHYGRERAVADAPVGDGGTSWIDLYGPATWDDYQALSDDDFLARMRETVAGWPAEEEQPPLGPLLDLLAAEIEAGRNPTPAVVARKLGMTAEEVGTYTGRLQGALSMLPAPVRYEAGGLQLTAAEMRAAAQALRVTPGHHVMPAFELAQSRLAGCGKKWYVKVARQEMHLYPGARLPAGTKTKRTSPVKFALQHWFDRLCPPLPEPSAPEPEPAEEDTTALDVLEAALWRMPGADAAKVDQVLEMAGPALAEAVRKAFGEGS